MLIKKNDQNFCCLVHYNLKLTYFDFKQRLNILSYKVSHKCNSVPPIQSLNGQQTQSLGCLWLYTAGLQNYFESGRGGGLKTLFLSNFIISN